MIESGFEEAERDIECKIFGWQQNFILFCVQPCCKEIVLFLQAPWARATVLFLSLEQRRQQQLSRHDGNESRLSTACDTTGQSVLSVTSLCNSHDVVIRALTCSAGFGVFTQKAGTESKDGESI